MIHINFYGLETIAKNIDDVPVAIFEMIVGFYIASEKCGKGFNIELKNLIADNSSIKLPNFISVR